jgi:ABC-type transport system substrate-binding protein
MNKVNNDIWIPELDGWVSIDEYIESVKQTIESEAPGVRPDGYQMKFASCSDQDGNLWREPYIKVYNQLTAEIITDVLNDVGIEASVDYYEDDDGDGDGGRPIIRKLWSVKLGVKIKAE